MTTFCLSFSAQQKRVAHRMEEFPVFTKGAAGRWACLARGKPEDGERPRPEFTMFLSSDAYVKHAIDKDSE